jgi:hypothetical protein
MPKTHDCQCAKWRPEGKNAVYQPGDKCSKCQMRGHKGSHNAYARHFELPLLAASHTVIRAVEVR